MKTKSFLFLLVAMLIIACGQSESDDQTSNPSPTYKVGSEVDYLPKGYDNLDTLRAFRDLVVVAGTTDDSIRQLHEWAYSSYLEFFTGLDGSYEYDDFEDGEMVMSYTFVGSNGRDVIIEVRSDSSVAVIRPGHIYEISVDTEKKFVYWARTFTKTDRSESTDKFKLSSFDDLRHALFLPMKMLRDAKASSVKKSYIDSVAFHDKMRDIVTGFR